MAKADKNKNSPPPRKPKKVSAPSTQKGLYISEIKQDTVVLKDGTLRTVLQVSSINFALKSEDEQQAIIQGYIQFLNSIDFEIQIVIQSRKLDIRKYLEELEQIAKEQTNELLKVQTVEYRQYIEELVTLSEIMEKKFFAIIPYSPFSKKRKNFLSRAQEVLLPSRVIKLADSKFDKYIKEMERRVSIVAGGLSSIGLKVNQLDTQSLIELYYQLYNPTRGSVKKMPNLNKLRVEQTQVDQND
ncbi:MAG: TraC family protein [bacterium]|nr:TraC family protein [bacterium]